MFSIVPTCSDGVALPGITHLAELVCPESASWFARLTKGCNRTTQIVPLDREPQAVGFSVRHIEIVFHLRLDVFDSIKSWCDSTDVVLSKYSSDVLQPQETLYRGCLLSTLTWELCDDKVSAVANYDVPATL